MARCQAAPDDAITSLQEVQEVQIQAAEAAAPQIAKSQAVSEIFAVDSAENAKVSCDEGHCSP